ncbi:HAD hydrolase family protein [Kordiimonas sp. SCSIO 12610]|nr:HAD hydrolase family protein [Kordiimonas sp. SCSIO 12610]
MDVDGVLTDGTIFYTDLGEELKAFNVQDGLGLKLLGKSGVQLAVISGRESKPLEKRLSDLGITEVWLKCANKVEALKDICQSHRIDRSEVAFMGDDLIDLGVMKYSGYAIAPQNGVAEVKAVANFVTLKEGGKGAVREACEHIAGLAGHRLIEFMDR